MEAFEPDIYEQKFLLHVLQTKSYHLLIERIDYVTRQFSRDENLVLELYLDLFLAGEQKLSKIIAKKCDILDDDFLCRAFRLAIQRKIKILDMGTRLCALQTRNYYILLLEEDSLELFLEQEDELRSFLDKSTIIHFLIKNGSLQIIHHLCQQGWYEEMITECLTYVSESRLALLASICDRYPLSTEFLTLKLVGHASDYRRQTCRLLFRSGANPNEEQRQKIMREAPVLYKELFEEDV